MTTKILTPPANPIIAAIHANPYPYYADLVTRQPLYYDSGLGMWIASSAQAVTDVLTSDLCRVRPPSEPVPTALIGSRAGDLFSHLIRMNDGAFHASLKPAVSSALVETSSSQIAVQSQRWAQALVVNHELTDFIFTLPVYVMGTLMGIPEDRLPTVADWINAYVTCLAPSATESQIEQGGAAATHLLDMVRPLITAPSTDLLAALTHHMANHTDQSATAANAIGLLMQAYQATAGLIGNALITLIQMPHVLAQIKSDVRLIPSLVEEVLRFDPAVQNTRRYVAESVLVAGKPVQSGDTILIVLAAANRDAALNPNPDHFDLFRQHRRYLTFGIGPHACPGDSYAITIASAAINVLLSSGFNPSHLSQPIRYMPSANARIPLLTFDRSDS